MPRLIPCPSCHNHVHIGDSECPHCGGALRTVSSPKIPMVIMGLALAGCPSAGEPEYGVPDTNTTMDSSDTATGTGSMTDSMTTDPGESEYGSPDTGDSSAGEPEYGVPDTTDTTGG